MQTLVIMNIVSGLIFSALAVPLILNKIKPNGLYGFRVPQTMNDPAIWYPVNQYAGKCLFYAGLIIAISAAGLAFWPGLSLDTYAWASLAVVMGTLTASIILSWRVMLNLTKKRS